MPRVPPQFEVLVGEAVAVLRAGEVARVASPGGGTIQVGLRPRAVQSYADELIAFEHDASFALSADDEPDEETEGWAVRVIEGVAEGEGGESAIFTVQIFPDRVPPGAAFDGALGALRDTLAASGAKARDRTVEVRRFVAGAERVGRRLAWSGGGEGSATDFFAFDLGPRTVVLALERADAEAEDAERKFDLVARSLRAPQDGSEGRT